MVNSGPLRAVLAYDEAQPPQPALSSIPGNLELYALRKGAALPNLPTNQIDLFILLADARTGISDTMISAWHFYQERLFPRLLIVQGLEETTTDFDDIVLIANRTLEALATHYLVLHDEDGNPSGLIELETGTVYDYSTSQVLTSVANPELLELVRDFQDEYRENFHELGADAFQAGLLAIAIPIANRNQLGIVEITRYLQLLSKR